MIVEARGGGGEERKCKVYLASFGMRLLQLSNRVFFMSIKVSTCTAAAVVAVVVEEVEEVVVEEVVEEVVEVAMVEVVVAVVAVTAINVSSI
jgi:hypothetical protein